LSIVVTGLTRQYGEQIAVNNISFQIEKGIVGFLGPNGAGKSTTMKMLTTYVPPTAGTATICGFDIVNQPMEVRQQVGYLPENNPLYYDMYVREYLLFAAKVHGLAHPLKKVEEIIEMTGLGKEAHKKLGQISKGYKQRAGLAQAMIHNPAVLILDEPTSGLDPNQLSEIRTLIAEVGSAKTVLLSTHIMQEVEAMCERVIIINEGKIIKNESITAINQEPSNSQTLIVVLDKNVSETAFKSFKHINQLKCIDARTWAIQSTQADLLKKELMHWAIDQDITIESLHTESKSLEDIFRSLTSNN
jgi:ABC-2 type transport system ATP-binding protein